MLSCSTTTLLGKQQPACKSTAASWPPPRCTLTDAFVLQLRCYSSLLSARQACAAAAAARSLVAQLWPHDAVGEAREVLHVGGGGQLPARSDAVGQPALKDDGLQLSARAVDGCSGCSSSRRSTPRQKRPNRSLGAHAAVQWLALRLLEVHANSPASGNPCKWKAVQLQE